MFEGWTAKEIEEYQERRAILDVAARTEGTVPQKAKKAGTSPATLWRLRELWKISQESGDPRMFLKGKSTGRPTVAGDLSQDVKDRLRRQRIKCGSTALAVWHFADDPLCPDYLREKILALPNPHAIPLSLRRACYVSPEAEAQYRGPVAYEHIGFKCRHNRTVIDPATGNARELQAGDLYISDDMSRNRYFWFPLSDPDIETRSSRGDKLARKYGVALGRQGLYTMDATGKWLGLSLVGCARDAYTSADVLRHMKSILQEHGKPRIGWILEKGCWAAQTVDGQKVWVPEEERSVVVGGLKSLGFLVEHVHTSEGKALIESGFNNLQRFHALQEGAPDIGRKRGEMERETRLIQRVQAGTIHPLEAGIESIEEATESDRHCCVAANGKAKNGRIQKGVPDEVWLRDTNRFQLGELEPKDMGVFMPVKLETQIRQGCLEKRIGGEIFRFTIPELFGTLGAGYRLMLCFDDSNPAAGAEVYNLETGSRNTQAWAHMEWIGHAEWENHRLLFGYSDQVAESIERKKRHHRAFVNAYAGTGIFGKRAMSAIESRDGRGNVTTIERMGAGRMEHGAENLNIAADTAAQADSDSSDRVHASPAGEFRPERSGRGVCPAVTTGGVPAGRADARPLSRRKTIVTDRFALIEA